MPELAGAGAGATGATTTAYGGAAAAECVGDETGADTAQCVAGFGAQDVGVCNVEVYARDFDVVVVFKSEQDGVGKAEVQLAVAHDVVDAGGVTEARSLVVGRGIRRERTRDETFGEVSLQVGVVLAGLTEVERADRDGRGRLRNAGLAGGIKLGGRCGRGCRRVRLGSRRRCGLGGGWGLGCLGGGCNSSLGQRTGGGCERSREQQSDTCHPLQPA